MSVKPMSQANSSVRLSRPQIERLEVRDVPSATHLSLALPTAPVTAGASVSVTVTALDATGHVAADYAGTVQLTSSDGQAQLPAAYTFTTADAGQHTFTVQLQTAGTPTVLATDAADGTITGTATVSVVPAAVDHFGVQVAANPTAGQAAAVTVIAQDAFGNTVPTYTGTAHFTTTDAQATAPADHTFTASDNGSFTTNVTLDTAGAQTVTVTDAGGIQGSGGATVAPAAATHFQITGPATAPAGQGDTVTVVALDAFGNVATNYTGTAVLSLTDAQGNAAADQVTHTFTASDAGTTTMTVTPQERGALTLGVADQADPTVTGSAGVTVQYATANDTYVAALFQQLLGRAPDRGELIHFTSMLDQDAPRSNVVQGIEAMPEFQTDAVTALYQNLLGRAPDPAGLNGFVTALQSGWTIDDVASAIMGSDEYFRLHGGSNTGFVTGLYQDLLQRAPDSAGLAAWTGMLNEGVSRWQVAQDIAQSSESDRDAVIATFQQFLNRAPDPNAQVAYVLLQQRGMTTTDLYAAVLGSDEYYQMTLAI
jgi:uncharacterized protein DUF4214